MDGPELDYAFIADYAVVQEGKLTAVGASYTVVGATSLPMPHSFAVGGRVRAPESTKSVALGFRIDPPGRRYSLTVGGELVRDPGAFAYKGKVGLLFAASMQIVIDEPGLYEVIVLIDDEEVRRLAFEVLMAEAPASTDPAES